MQDTGSLSALSPRKKIIFVCKIYLRQCFGRLSTFWCVPSNLWVAMNNVLLLRNAYHYSTNFPPSRFSQVLFGTPGSIRVLLGTQIYLWLALNHVLLLYKPCTILPFSQVLLGIFGYLFLLCWWISMNHTLLELPRTTLHSPNFPSQLAKPKPGEKRMRQPPFFFALHRAELPRLTAASE